MADDHMSAAHFQQHGGTDCAGVGALFFPVQILRADRYARTPAALNRNVKIDVGRADHDFVPGVAGNQGQEVKKKGPCLLGILVHLPVGCHQLFAGHGILSGKTVESVRSRFCDPWWLQKAVTTKDTKDHEGIYFLSVSASTPGSFLPSRNSSEAPPPVEMWVILSATPAALTAATESPPPTIVVAPAFSARASAIWKVPLAKGGNSKTPMGPFQTMVRARATSSENVSIDCGPISSAIMLAGMGSPWPTILVKAPAATRSAMT